MMTFRTSPLMGRANERTSFNTATRPSSMPSHAENRGEPLFAAE